MTLEDVAGAIQRDFLAIRKDMATKEDLRLLRQEAKEDARLVREDMGNLRDDLAIRITTVKEDLSEQIAGLKYAKEIDELRARVVRVEQKLGLKRTPAA